MLGQDLCRVMSQDHGIAIVGVRGFPSGLHSFTAAQAVVGGEGVGGAIFSPNLLVPRVLCAKLGRLSAVWTPSLVRIVSIGASLVVGLS